MLCLIAVAFVECTNENVFTLLLKLDRDSCQWIWTLLGWLTKYTHRSICKSISVWVADVRSICRFNESMWPDMQLEHIVCAVWQNSLTAILLVIRFVFDLWCQSQGYRCNGVKHYLDPLANCKHVDLMARLMVFFFVKIWVLRILFDWDCYSRWYYVLMSTCYVVIRSGANFHLIDRQLSLWSKLTMNVRNAALWLTIS